jgi:hypothetical protein
MLGVGAAEAEHNRSWENQQSKWLKSVASEEKK